MQDYPPSLDTVTVSILHLLVCHLSSQTKTELGGRTSVARPGVFSEHNSNTVLNQVIVLPPCQFPVITLHLLVSLISLEGGKVLGFSSLVWEVPAFTQIPWLVRE